MQYLPSFRFPDVLTAEEHSSTVKRCSFPQLFTRGSCVPVQVAARSPRGIPNWCWCWFRMGQTALCGESDSCVAFSFSRGDKALKIFAQLCAVHDNVGESSCLYADYNIHTNAFPLQKKKTILLLPLQFKHNFFQNWVQDYCETYTCPKTVFVCNLCGWVFSNSFHEIRILARTKVFSQVYRLLQEAKS